MVLMFRIDVMDKNQHTCCAELQQMMQAIKRPQKTL